MGIIMGALAGAGEQMANIGATNMKADLDLQNKLAVGQQESDLALQRAKALEEFKVSLTDQMRTAQVGRVNAAAGGIVSGAMNAKYASSDAAVQAANAGQTDAPLTPEQQAVIDQAKGADRDRLMMDPKVRMQAAIQTGDISPEKAATMGQSAEINQMKLDALMQRAEDKNATAKEIADIRAESMKYGYELRLQAAQERRINGKIDTATGRMLITSEDANIKAATSQLNMLNRQLDSLSPGKNGDAQRESIKAQMDELRTGIKESQETKAGYLKSMNLMPDKKEAAAPDGAPIIAGAKTPAGPAKPASQAAFDALPSGALFINPADGKTYKKK